MFFTPPSPHFLDLQPTKPFTMRNILWAGSLITLASLRKPSAVTNPAHPPLPSVTSLPLDPSNVRSSRLTSVDSPKLALSAQPSAFGEALDHYSENELPNTGIVLRCTVQHCTLLRISA
jgi:hypothetical protein